MRNPTDGIWARDDYTIPAEVSYWRSLVRQKVAREAVLRAALSDETDAQELVDLAESNQLVKAKARGLPRAMSAWQRRVGDHFKINGQWLGAGIKRKVMAEGYLLLAEVAVANAAFPIEGVPRIVDERVALRWLGASPLRMYELDQLHEEHRDAFLSKVIEGLSLWSALAVGEVLRTHLRKVLPLLTERLMTVEEAEDPWPGDMALNLRHRWQAWLEGEENGEPLWYVDARRLGDIFIRREKQWGVVFGRLTRLTWNVQDAAGVERSASPLPWMEEAP